MARRTLLLSTLLLCATAAACCPTNFQGLTGQVVTRDSPGFASGRLNRVDQDGRLPDPCAVLFASTVQDVVNAVKWVTAPGREIPFRVRAGRENGIGLSNVDDGLVVDVSRMRRAIVDEVTGRGSFDAGLDMFTVYQIVDRYGFAFPGGASPTSGLAGHTLGGGFGYMSRKYGMASDNLLGAEVVTASGDIVYASDIENPDLFWALRGGGSGNFGVVTRLDFQLVPKPSNIVIKTITYSGVNRKKAVQFFFKWQKSIADLPDELTTSFQWFSGKKKGSVDARVLVVFLGGHADLDLLLEPLMKIDAPFQVTTEDHSFLDAMVYLANCQDRLDCMQRSSQDIKITDVLKTTYRSRYVANDGPLRKKDITQIVDWIGNLPRENGIQGMLLIDSYGGAISQIPPTQTAFPHRDMLYAAKFVGSWTTEEQHEQVNEWIDGFYGEMIPHMSKSAYINYGDLTLPKPLEAYYGENLHRLREVKSKWDPLNFFAHELGIPLLHPNY